MTDVPSEIERIADRLSALMGQYADGKFQAIVGANGDICLRKTFHRTARPMVRVAEAMQELKEAMHAAYGTWPADFSKLDRDSAEVVLSSHSLAGRIVLRLEPGVGANG